MKPLRTSLASLLVACLAAAPGWASATLVRIDTNYGPIDINLFDAQVPVTVNNFLSYVRDNSYADSFFHRSARESSFSIIQGGGFRWSDATSTATSITTRAPIALEYSDTRPNARGTIGMARTSVQDSATSQWFINITDNSSVFGAANGGGYAVFGRLTTPSLAVADAISALTVVNAAGCNASTGALSQLPVVTRITTCAQIVKSNLVTVGSAKELATTTATASDRIFNYLEAAYAAYATPASPPSQTDFGYYYRFYSKTNGYLGTKDGNVYYLLPENNGVPVLIGTVAQWLATATEAGY